LEDGLDRARPPEDAHEACAATPFHHESEVARLGLPEAFAVERQRRAGNEVGLADEVLAPALDLYN